MLSEITVERIKALPKTIVKNITYPHPFSAEENDIGALDLEKVAECYNNSLCSVCGQINKGPYVFTIDVESTKRQVIFEKENDVVEMKCCEPPMHEECAAFALRLCPKLNSQVVTVVTAKTVKYNHYNEWIGRDYTIKQQNPTQI